MPISNTSFFEILIGLFYTFIFFGAGVFALILVIFGFIALLKQKTYIDIDTKQPIEVELPIIGKLKTNYPSIVFVVLGVGFGGFIVRVASDIEIKKQEQQSEIAKIKQEQQSKETSWTIAGRFIYNINDTIKWSPDKLSIIPKTIPYINKDTGEFSFTVNIQGGKTFEDLYTQIAYTDDDFSISIPVDSALIYYELGDDRYLKTKDDHSRIYQTISAERF